MFRSCRGSAASFRVSPSRWVVAASSLGLLLVATPALAAAGAEDSRELAEVVVTASRIAEPIDQSLSSVTVIRREDIQRAQARTVEELLAGVEGVSVAGGGGLGKVAAVFLRGAESDHTLWLVDGVRIGSVTAGLPTVWELPVDSIERIEIVRGPRSSLYGADAIGGVVQVFTRRGRDAAPSLRLTGGSHGTLQGGAALGFGGERAWVDLQASHLETDGIDACRGLPFPPGGGCFTSEPDRDPYRNSSVNLRTGLQLTPGLDAQAFVQRTEGRASYDGSFVNQSETVNQVAGLEFDGALGDRWHSRLSVGRSWDDNESFRVRSVDEDAELVEIEYLDGDIEELDLDTWQELDLEMIDTPEGWSGDDAEEDDEEEDEDEDEDDDWDEDEDDDEDDDDWDDDDADDENY